MTAIAKSLMQLLACEQLGRRPLIGSGLEFAVAVDEWGG